ncbi:MAG TPA: hypothetical protein VIP46_08380, partial [Pyrinomonadaceae bacterium]
GTLNRLAKWADTGGAGALADSAVTESGGNVGIGVAAPGDLLDLAGPTNVSGRTGIRVRTTSPAGNSTLYFDNDRGDFSSYGGLLTGGSQNPFGFFGVGRPDRTFLIADGPTSLGLGIGTLTAQPVIFGTSNAERVRIDANGNVGVGVTVPQSRLHAAGDIRVSGAGSGFVFSDGTKMTTASGVGGAGTAGTIPLWTGATTLGNSVVTQSGGNVGIGTNAPAAKLEVVGGAAGGVAASSTGGFALHGSNPSGWAVGAEGNARQSRDRGGWVKAMIYVDRTGAITRCFNSFEPDGGASLAGCGFTVTHPGTGVYTVAFPFAVNDRFYSLAAQAASTTESPRLNTGANFEFDVNPNSLVISTFLVDAAGNQTADGSFMLVVY